MSEIMDSIKKSITDSVNNELEYLGEQFERDLETFKFIVETQFKLFKIYEKKREHLQKLYNKNTTIQKYFRVEKIYENTADEIIKRANHKIRGRSGLKHTFIKSESISMIIEFNPIYKWVNVVGFRYFKTDKAITRKEVFASNKDYIMIDGKKFAFRIKPNDLFKEESE